MMDMGSYVVHMARMLGGEEPTVTGGPAKLHRRHRPGHDRRAAFPSGHTATVHCSMWSSSLLHLAARVTGDDGELRVFNPIAPQPSAGSPSGPAGPAAPRSRPAGPPTTTSWRRSATPSCGAAPVLTPPADAVANMTIIDAVYRAANMRPRGT